MQEREIEYHGNSEKKLKAFPKKKLEKFAYSLFQLQNRMDTCLEAKQMKGLGDNVIELISNGKPAYRCVYVIIDDVIHVLHAFVKSSDGTDSKHEKTIKLRYKRITSK
jgi:phage-related protein